MMNAQCSMVNEEVNATKTRRHKDQAEHFQINSFSNFHILTSTNIKQRMINDECSMLNEEVNATKARRHKDQAEHFQINSFSNFQISTFSHQQISNRE